MGDWVPPMLKLFVNCSPTLEPSEPVSSANDNSIRALVATGLPYSAAALPQRKNMLHWCRIGFGKYCGPADVDDGARVARLAPSPMACDMHLPGNLAAHQAGMRKYMNEFRGELKDAAVALFYFKGVTLDTRRRSSLWRATPHRQTNRAVGHLARRNRPTS